GCCLVISAVTIAAVGEGHIAGRVEEQHQGYDAAQWNFDPARVFATPFACLDPTRGLSPARDAGSAPSGRALVTRVSSRGAEEVTRARRMGKASEGHFDVVRSPTTRAPRVTGFA